MRETAGGDIGELAFIPSASCSYRIVRLDRIGPYGSKVASGAFEIEGVGVFDFDLYVSATRPPSISPGSVRSRYTGQYQRTFKLDPDFRAELLTAALCRLGEPARDDDPR